MSKTEIMAYHGWGFDANCWHNLQNLVPKNMEWKNFDRGYFGSPESPKFSDQSDKKIIITHSFGLHQCRDATFKEADMVIIFSGFLSFHPKAAQFQRRSKQVVSEMINQIDDHPLEVLKAFYRNVYHPEKEFNLPSKTLNKPLLLKDLKKLNSTVPSLPTLQKSAKVFIFHGTDDAIVPKRKGRALFERFGDIAQYFEIKAGGHALPMTHAQKCWQMIEPNIV